jgi:nucleoside-diphosphate-sugar epimerase
MKVAVTGAAGSLGRALAARTGDAKDLIAFPPRSELDLAGPAAALREWIAANRPEAIIHLAGRRGGDAGACVRDNVATTIAVLDAVAALGDPIRVVLASSAAVYGQAPPSGPLDVRAVRRPVNVYGTAKALAEDACALAAAGRNVDVSVARIFNVVGAPGDTWSVVPSLVARILAADGAPVAVANADCTRDFVHVDDLCAALWSAATQRVAPPLFNVATGAGTTIAALAESVARALGRAVEFRFAAAVDADTIRYSVGDPREALELGCRFRPISDADIIAVAESVAARLG